MQDYSLGEIKQIMNDYIFGSEHPDLKVYREDFGTKFSLDRWIDGIRSNCDLGNFYGKKILEVGCGFGWDAVGLALIGRNEVVATDILPSMIDGTKECLESVMAKGHQLPIRATLGDICSIDLPENSFDGIYSSEAIEHVHDLDAMFERCLRLLRPGGRLLIINDSNRFNTKFRDATLKMWVERDESWEHANFLSEKVRPVEHKGAKPYSAMRQEILVEVAPGLNDKSRETLIAATAGMNRTEIELAAMAYRASGTLPERPPFSWCRNPETGEYAERLLDPFELREMLRQHGFKDVKLRHKFNKWPQRLINGIAFRPLNELVFDKKGVFALVANKP